MKVLVVGSGGREHALAWKLAQSPKVTVVYVAPGNAGTALDKRLQNVAITDHATLAEFALAEKVGLTVIGPDAALAEGIVDLFQSKGLRVFGPTKAAAELEWSKDFAKGFMKRHGVPTAAYETFTDAAAAHAYIDAQGAPIVIKADGLAAGKGVVVAMTLAEAHEAVDMIMVDAKYGASGSRVVIEEFMAGEEASFFVLCDGKHMLAMASAQDHKRLLDGDKGPNTGGMGAYSPAPIVTPDLHAKVMQQVVKPTVAGMAAEGRPFTGFLYVGLMIDAAGNPRVVEFNSRMGDPETQPIMARLKSDLLPVLEAAVDGRLDQAEMEWDRRTALCVILASDGYPDNPRKGDPIMGIPAESDDAIVFHAGTAAKDGQIVTAGGRVLCVVGLGDSVKIAQNKAYEAAAPIRFAGMQFRTDIGHRAIKRG
ncbi:phosphoribosylamine--glycine ligase [Derxia gummosa]|uniref:Phosphoribosylamine--glycine ligase n=1 Tax=Derxia gummosa DSM 723 TaxID=1121388 RepID=A0A8B6X3T3_9BURK|nr:phosphoribosylamine--glycine ligase [Derxia gummosa]